MYGSATCTVSIIVLCTVDNYEEIIMKTLCNKFIYLF